MPPTVSVVVPTYRRPDSLRRCLAALAAQTDGADEVLVVCRAEDAAARAVIDEGDGAGRAVLVDRPGVVEAMLTGSRASRGDVVAFCDDDAMPRPDWVGRIRDAFAGDASLAGLGGVDVLGPPHPVYPPTQDVGRMSRWGRMSGNHHRGAGPPREVDVLKAVNMAVRADALAFPQGLRGSGAQVHFEVTVCAAAARRGRVVFDPALIVDHHPEARFDDDVRDVPAAAAIEAMAFNYALSLASVRPDLARRHVAYAVLVGDAGLPGLVRTAYALRRGDVGTARRLGPSLRGLWSARRAVRRGERVTLIPVRRS